jgi:hypothetical protein
MSLSEKSLIIASKGMMPSITEAFSIQRYLSMRMQTITQTGSIYLLNNIIFINCVMPDVPYEFAIDVSGTPKGTTYFGLASFHPYYKNRILKELYETFRECNYQKGRQMKHEKLKEILVFLDKKGVRMSTICFPSILWHEYYDIYKRHHAFLEKMYAVNYMNLINSLTRKHNSYSLTSCVETQAGDINVVFHNCRRLASKIQIELDCSYGHDKTNRLIKVADIIASGGRKLKTSDLDEIRNYRIVHYNWIQRWTKWTSKYLFELRK